MKIRWIVSRKNGITVRRKELRKIIKQDDHIILYIGRESSNFLRREEILEGARKLVFSPEEIVVLG